MKNISKVLIGPFLQVAAFDEEGAQIPELQCSLLDTWTRNAQACGYLVDETRIETFGQPIIFHRVEGKWQPV
jgi:hypothetical protein